MKLKKEIQAIKELNEQEKQAQAAKAAAAQVKTNIKISNIIYLANINMSNMIVRQISDKYENRLHHSQCRPLA